jgi:cytochrome c oxidase subunit 1
MSVQTISQPVVAAPSAVVSETRFRLENRLSGWQIGIAMSALSLGIFLGIMQGLEHAGFDFYKYIRPIFQSYYQGLTIHGVLNALVWTTFFITGFFTTAITRSLDTPITKPGLAKLGFGLMVVGLLMTAYPLFFNLATVLYTFYPPLKADWTFYLGLTLIVVGSWVTGYAFYFTYGAWRKAHKGVTTPFIALAALITMVMWQIATLGVAVEILALLLPWSLGLLPGTDALLGRTLFWFTGHPLVYFWLLPAYVSWYGMVPKQAGGKLFSGNLGRLVFWLFLILSTPVGFHHQYTDPGIPQGWKMLHGLFTYGVAFPSLLTAFTIAASLESGGRARGGKGWFGWIRKLPWDNPSFVAQNFAMILFAFGGISGVTNASYSMNLAVHNTTWIPGHFHLTVGSATTLTFFGIAYWLVPMLSGRQLFSPKAALAQAWTWLIGMIFFSNGMHLLGLHFGAPRRTMLGAAPYRDAAWNPMLMESLLGVLVLTVSAFLFFYVILGTVLAGKKLKTAVEMPVAESLDESPTPAWLDTWRGWVYGAVALVIVAYGPMLYTLFSEMQLIPLPPNFRVW